MMGNDQVPQLDDVPGQGVPVPPVPPAYTAPPAPPVYAAVPPVQKKKSKAGLICVIVALVVVICTGVACLAYFISQSGGSTGGSGKSKGKGNGTSPTDGYENMTGPDVTVPDSSEPEDRPDSTRPDITEATDPEPSEPEPTDPERPDHDYYYVATKKDPLIIRFGPGQHYDEIGSLPKGTVVDVLYWQNGWACIGDGWVNGEYLSRTPPADVPATQIYYVTADSGLLLRTGPGTDYTYIRNLPYGTEVEILYWSGNWAYDGEGWLSGDYLSTTPPATYPTGDVYYVNAESGLLLRTGPGTTYSYIRNIPYGTMVEVLYWNGNWAYIGDGWLSGDYLVRDLWYDDYYCDHVWEPATCQTPRYCVQCYQTSGSALGHSYSGGKCVRCNAKDPNYSSTASVKVVPLTDQTGTTISSGMAKIEEVSFRVSGSTLYVTIDFKKGASSSYSSPIKFTVTVYGEYSYLTEVDASTESLYGGESTTVTVSIPDIISSDYDTYKVWIGSQY